MSEIIRIGLAIDDRAAAQAIERTTSGLNRVGLAGEGGTKGINKIERSLSALAFRAAGIPGPIGSLSTALLQFGTGGMVTISVVAGLALIAGAIKLMGMEAEKTEKSMASLVGLATGGGGMAEAARAPLLARQAQLAALGAGGRNTLMGQSLTDSQRNANRDEYARVSHALRVLELAAVNAAGGLSVVARVAAPASGGAFAPGMAGDGGLSMYGLSKGMMGGVRGQLRMNASDTARFQRMAAETGGARPGMGLGDGLGIASAGLGMIAGASGRGNAAGSFLQGAGGLIGSIPGGQIAGPIVGILGGIVSLFGRGESAAERQVKELEKVNANLQEQLEFQKREELRSLSIRVRPGALDDPRSADTLARIIRDARDRKVNVDAG